MNGLVVFLAMSASILGYAMMFGTKPANVRMTMVASRRYRVTHQGPNTWLVERVDELLKPIASAVYVYGKDLQSPTGDTTVVKQLASDILVFPANLFS